MCVCVCACARLCVSSLVIYICVFVHERAQVPVWDFSYICMCVHTCNVLYYFVFETEKVTQ